MKKMKQIILSSIAISLSTGMLAQNIADIFPKYEEKIEIHSSDYTNNIVNQKAAGDTIYTNSFDDANDWTISTPNVQGQWEWVTTSPAAMTQYMGAMTSSTASNGFAVFNGIQYLLAPPVELQDATIELNNTLDLSTYAAVSLKFEQHYKAFNSDQTFLELSNDNGVTWTQIELNTGVATNTYNTSNPDMNVSAYIAGASQVKIRFRWTCTDDSDSYGSGYGWMIDDLELYESLDNDLVNTASYFGTLGLPYYLIPDEQVTAIDFYSVALNNGGVDQPNTTLTVDVNGGTFTGTSNSVYSVSGNIDTLICSSQYTPATSLGSHAITWTIASDSVDNAISDNSKTGSFEVTDYIYARDMDSVDGGRDNGGEAYEYGNYFDVINNQTLTYVDFNISTNANIGAVVYGAVYMYDANSQSFVWQESTDDYILTSNNVNNGEMLSLPLFSPLNLTGGEGYLVVAGSYGDGGVTADLRITTSGTSEPGNSLIYVNGSAGLDWYWTTATPMVRMNFDPSWGVVDYDNYDAVLGQNTPNPFSDNTSINIELMSSSNIDFDITDITGKVVKHIELGFLGAGNHNININSDNLKSGIYYYSITSGEFKLTKKMIKQN